MGHNSFAKAYAEMKAAKYNPDGTLKEKAARSAMNEPPKHTDEKQHKKPLPNYWAHRIIGG